MRHFAVLIAGSLVACAAHNSAPAAAPHSVQAATDTPSSLPSSTLASTVGPAAVPPAARTRTAHGYSYPAVGNAVALPTQGPPSASDYEDNSRVHVGDHSGNTLPAMDLGSESDLKLTRRIRRALENDSSLSVPAKNVKIITLDGKVTLRGEVSTGRELKTIGFTAKRIAGRTRVDNLLEVSQ